MKLVELAEVAEVIAAVGVLISLLYVGYEIKQNTVAVKSSAYQAIHDAEDEFWSDLTGDATMALLWEKGLESGLQNLEPSDRTRFVLAARRLIYIFQNVHYQNRKEVVDDELWLAWVASIDEFLVQPGFRDVLEIARPHLSDPFNQLLDSRIMLLSQQ